MRGDRAGNLVMVADDNMFIRFLVRKWLGHEAQVVEAGDGADVIAIYKEHKPDVLFLDIHLPHRSGKEILQDILVFDPDAFVIMLSADSIKENILYSVQRGAKAFITKPFTRETLAKYYTLCPTIVRTPQAEEAAPAAETGTTPSQS